MQSLVVQLLDLLDTVHELRRLHNTAKVATLSQSPDNSEATDVVADLADLLVSQTGPLQDSGSTTEIEEPETT